MSEKHYSGFAITSFVLAIIGVIYFFIVDHYNIYFPFSFSTLVISCFLPIVFGIIALDKINKNKKLKGKAFAYIGIILISLVIIYFLVYAFMNSYH